MDYKLEKGYNNTRSYRGIVPILSGKEKLNPEVIY
jgi:hypothetical protein